MGWGIATISTRRGMFRRWRRGDEKECRYNRATGLLFLAIVGASSVLWCSCAVAADNVSVFAGRCRNQMDDGTCVSRTNIRIQASCVLFGFASETWVTFVFSSLQVALLLEHLLCVTIPWTRLLMD